MKARKKSVSFMLLGGFIGITSGASEGIVLFIMLLLSTFCIYYAGYIMGEYHAK